MWGWQQVQLGVQLRLRWRNERKGLEKQWGGAGTLVPVPEVETRVRTNGAGLGWGGW